MRIFALWCHPRSVSTAFERVMRERGDLDVLHEPFMYDYYLNRAPRRFPDFRPDPDHPADYADTRQMILRRAEGGPVFFKDMAYYVLDTLPDDAEFRDAITHAFLVRHPAESILSYARKDPGFASVELGIEAEWVLYQTLREAGYAPLVILSDDLRRDPEAVMRAYGAHVGLRNRPEALSWDRQVPSDWEAVQAWHGEVLASGQIRPPEREGDPVAEVAALGAPYTDYLDHHLTFYEILRDVAEAQRRDF